MRTVHHVLLATAMVSAHLVTAFADEDRAATATGDRFVGTYVRGPFIGTYGNVGGGEDSKVLKISKSGKTYRLSGPYAEYSFVPKADGVLQDVMPGANGPTRGGLGTITAGRMTFADGSAPVDVLKVEFCYEHFLLIKRAEPGGPQAAGTGSDGP